MRRLYTTPREVEPRTASMPVVIGSGSHPFPFRTRKLSLIPPMVLRGKLCGRVGRCRHYFEGPIMKMVGPLICTPAGTVARYAVSGLSARHQRNRLPDPGFHEPGIPAPTA